METLSLPSVTAALLDALAVEADLLDGFGACVGRQLDALRDGDIDAFEAAAADAADAVSALDRAGRARRREHEVAARTAGLPADRSLLDLAAALPADAARPIGEARDRVRAAATTADGRCDALAFALRYAVGLGRETLAAWRDLGTERPAHVYTATGTAPSGAARPLLNQMG